MKKRILTLVLILSMLFVMGVSGFTVSAANYASLDTETISPRFTNCNECDFMFRVLDPGEAHVGVTYYAKSDVFTQAKLTVKIQKKFLGLFWRTVDIGTTNDEWIAYSNDVYGEFYNCFNVDGTGTYRAVFCVEIYGTSGAVDTIENTIEYKYT